MTLESHSPGRNPSEAGAWRSARRVLAVAGLWVLFACDGPRSSATPVQSSSAGASPSAAAAPSAGGALVGASGRAPVTLPEGAGNPGGGGAIAALPSPAAPPGVDAGAELAPVLHAPGGAPLPQTRERPSTESPSFRLRLEQLARAIVEDDPERAMAAFFPRVAYEQVKAVADPGRDWQERLVRAFQRDIHEYHRTLGPDAAGAKLVGLVVNENAVRWIDPGKEGNRLGYYRVTRSRLRFRWDGGTERQLELTSLISWRGEWYVVHLHGFG